MKPAPSHQYLQLKENDETKPLRLESDQLGFTHEKFQQFYKSVKVEGATYTIHSGTASAMTSQLYNVGSYDQIEVEFYFYSYSMENGEDFWLRYYDGSSWNTVATYARGTNFNNNTFYSATVTISSANYNFPSNAQFRLQCDASGNAGHIYIDQVTITASSGGASFAAAPVGSSATIKELCTPDFDTEGVDLEEHDFSADFVIYPNPARDILKIQSADQITAVKIYNMSGALMQNIEVINNEIKVSRLSTGLYIIEVVGMEETVARKFSKQ